MTRDPYPAFMLNAKDWLSSRAVRCMDAEQRGWYIQLLAESWDSTPKPFLPKDEKMLMVLAGANTNSHEFKERWAFVMNKFKENEQGLYNERLLDEHAYCMDKQRQASAAGKKSAETRRRMKEERERALNGRTTGVDSPLERKGNGNQQSESESESESNQNELKAFISFFNEKLGTEYRWDTGFDMRWSQFWRENQSYSPSDARTALIRLMTDQEYMVKYGNRLRPQKFIDAEFLGKWLNYKPETKDTGDDLIT